MKLLALIFAYIISHLFTKPQRFRNFKWYESWAKWWNEKTDFSNKESTAILTVALPVLVISVILFALVDSLLGYLILSVLVLFYVIGPESLDEDIASDDYHKRLGLRKNASPASIIKTMTKTSLHRWFGVFFWYVILGIAGALIYRLSERLDSMVAKDDKRKPATQKTLQVLNYPVSWMMVISLAIASDFERIFKKCKPYMNWDNIQSMNDTFLYEATDFAVENCEIEPDNEKSIEQVTLSVLKRMLLVWLVVVSIQVILAI